jgi:hypothetical protein
MKSVAICGSCRFAEGMREFARKLKSLGVLVYEPELYRASGGVWEEVKDYDKKFVALGLTLGHFQKMRMADVIYIYNQDGYAGVSTNIEIGYAVSANKPIYVYESKDEEPYRQCLFAGVAKTPEDLLAYLK